MWQAYKPNRTLENANGREGEGERLRFSTAKNYHSGPTERTAIVCSVAHSDRRYISFLESGFGDFSSINLSKKGLCSAVTFGTVFGKFVPWRNAAGAFHFTDYCYDFTPSNIRMTMLEVFLLSQNLDNLIVTAAFIAVRVRETILRPRCTVNRDAAEAAADAFQARPKTARK